MDLNIQGYKYSLCELCMFHIMTITLSPRALSLDALREV
jgi:hypothetical protein